MVQRPYQTGAHAPDLGATHEQPAPRFESERPPGDPVNAAREIPDLVDELREYLGFYTSARKDLAAAKLRSGLGKGAWGALGGMVAFSAIVVSVGLLFTGLAQGLGWLFGGRFWLGYVVLGAAVLILVGIATWIVLGHWKKASRQETIRKYEDKKQVQELRFRHNVCELQERSNGHKHS